jgi:hypothetical protein
MFFLRKKLIAVDVLSLGNYNNSVNTLRDPISTGTQRVIGKTLSG